MQEPLRKPVITETRSVRQCRSMAKRDPSKRAKAFKAWMALVGTNTRQVANRSGVAYTTLASFVQGDTQSLKGENEELIANAFGTSALEVFAGFASTHVPVIGRVGADAEGRVLFAEGDDPREEVPIPPGGTDQARGLKVVGHSMRGVVDDGGLIYFEDQRTPPTPDMLNRVCVVETVEGEVLVKRLLKGSEAGVFDLESVNGPTMPDRRLKWAAHVTAIIPPWQTSRVLRSTIERQIA